VVVLGAALGLVALVARGQGDWPNLINERHHQIPMFGISDAASTK
jgi:hypothetical protein